VFSLIHERSRQTGSAQGSDIKSFSLLHGQRQQILQNVQTLRTNKSERIREAAACLFSGRCWRVSLLAERCPRCLLQPKFHTPSSANLFSHFLIITVSVRLNVDFNFLHFMSIVAKQKVLLFTVNIKPMYVDDGYRSEQENVRLLNGKNMKRIIFTLSKIILYVVLFVHINSKVDD
jgi:hypothetical protein